MLYIAALVVLAVGSALLLVRYRRQKVVRGYKRFQRWRTLISSIILVLVAWTFLRSGRPLLIGIAIVLIFLVTMYVIVDKPNETLS